MQFPTLFPCHVQSNYIIQKKHSSVNIENSTPGSATFYRRIHIQVKIKGLNWMLALGIGYIQP